jgi:hypothetical protein
MGIRAKSLLDSVLFNKFCHRTNLVALLCSNFVYTNDNGVSTYLEFRIPTQNGELKVLFKKFHRRVNLMALLVTKLGSST